MTCGRHHPWWSMLPGPGLSLSAFCASAVTAPGTVHPAPCTLHPAPCTLHPAPCTLQLKKMRNRYELVHQRVAERRLRQARQAGAKFLEEKVGSATTYITLRVDQRLSPPTPLAESLVPPALRPGGKP